MMGGNIGRQKGSGIRGMHRVNENGTISIVVSGDEGDRTPGLGIANAALSQLSYIPTISICFGM
jgi:hypothetical protein